MPGAELLGIRLALLDLQTCPLGRLLQPLTQHRTRRQARQVLGHMDARLAHLQQLDLLLLLACSQNNAQRRRVAWLLVMAGQPAQV